MLSVTSDVHIARTVLSRAFASVPNPTHCLQEAIQRLCADQKKQQLAELQMQAEDAMRRGDIELERKLVREILVTRKQVD